MMDEINDHTYVYQFITMCGSLFESPHNYYFHCLQEFTSKNKTLIDVEGHKYNLHKEGLVDTIYHNYLTTAFDYKFYYTTASTFVLQKFDEDMCEPLINNKFKFTRKALSRFLYQELSKSKKIYYKAKFKYFRYVLRKKIFMCGCFSSNRNGYYTIKENNKTHTDPNF
jgi:hypothetical protein